MTNKEKFNQLESICMTGGIARYRTINGYCACSYNTDYREAEECLKYKKCPFANNKLEQIVVERYPTNAVLDGTDTKISVYAYKCLVYPHFENERGEFDKNGTK